MSDYPLVHNRTTASTRGPIEDSAEYFYSCPFPFENASFRRFTSIRSVCLLFSMRRKTIRTPVSDIIFLLHLLISVHLLRMATGTTDNSCCSICQKQKNIFTCPGCARYFCLPHLNEHQEELSVQLGQTEDRCNHFQDTLQHQDVALNQHPLLKQINEWEKESIDKIKRLANDVRLRASACIKESTADLKVQFRRLTEKISQYRKDKDFADNDVQFFDEELQRLKALLDTPPNGQIEFSSVILHQPDSADRQR